MSRSSRSLYRLCLKVKRWELQAWHACNSMSRMFSANTSEASKPPGRVWRAALPAAQQASAHSVSASVPSPASPMKSWSWIL